MFQRIGTEILWGKALTDNDVIHSVPARSAPHCHNSIVVRYHMKTHVTAKLGSRQCRRNRGEAASLARDFLT